MRQKWKKRILCAAIGVAAGIVYAKTATMPDILAPCHGFASGDAMRMVISWSASHPVWAGFWSALSFGWWPAHGYFGMPWYCDAGDYGRGIPVYWYMDVVRNAFPAFQWSRGIFAGLLWAAGSCLLWRLGGRSSRFLAARRSSPGSRNPSPQPPEQSDRRQPD